MDSEEKALRVLLADRYKHIARIGLNELASGNVSCRFRDGLLISPSGATGESISPDNIVRVTFSGECADDQKPSSEWRMHAAIYARHAGAHAVVHTHSDYCVAVACRRKALPGFHYLIGTFGGTDVPCVPYSTFGTEVLGSDAAAALRERTACLLGSHGMIARGRDLDEAVMFAHRLEIMCRQYHLACQWGEPELLTREEWEAFFEQERKLAYGDPFL